MKPTLRIVASLALATATLPALAQGDPETGKVLAYTCTGCHGVPGYKNVYPHYHVPKIAGQNYEYLMAALTAYQKGERPHPTMRAQAEGYSQEDLSHIAAYLSSLNKEAAQ
ncbi:c-type cytochrome [Aquimonas sp.]|jgi:cytochrome c553|uniref:c-type cytochrome n=1 Tax=Aquimonas sp. TaxID=1872588 RepID=UPI0037BF913B